MTGRSSRETNELLQHTHTHTFYMQIHAAEVTCCDTLTWGLLACWNLLSICGRWRLLWESPTGMWSRVRLYDQKLPWIQFIRKHGGDYFKSHWASKHVGNNKCKSIVFRGFKNSETDANTTLTCECMCLQYRNTLQDLLFYSEFKGTTKQIKHFPLLPWIRVICTAEALNQWKHLQVKSQKETIFNVQSIVMNQTWI